MSVSYMHAFDVQEAKKYGMESAVILQTLRLWILKNRNDGEKRYYHEGRWWCTVTVEGWKKGLPYFSSQKIWRLIDKLCELGVIVKGNHAPNKWTRTLWYAFADQSFLPPDEDAACDENDDIDPVSESEKCRENDAGAELSLVSEEPVTAEITHFSKMIDADTDKTRNLHNNDVTDEIMHFSESKYPFFKNEKSIFQNCKMNNKEVIYVSNLLKEKIKNKKEIKNVNTEMIGILSRAYDARTAASVFIDIECELYSDALIVSSNDLSNINRVKAIFDGRFTSYLGKPIYFVVYLPEESVG